MSFQKTINIQGWGDVVLKKFSWVDKNRVRGKIVEIDVDKKTGKEITRINSEGLWTWTTIYSIRSLPGHVEFFKYSEDKQIEILSDPALEPYMAIVQTEALNYNRFNAQEVGKKNSSGNEETS